MNEQMSIFDMEVKPKPRKKPKSHEHKEKKSPNRQTEPLCYTCDKAIKRGTWRLCDGRHKGYVSKAKPVTECRDYKERQNEDMADGFRNFSYGRNRNNVRADRTGTKGTSET